MNSSPPALGVFTVDVDLVVTSWDAWMARTSGLESSRACGQSLALLYPELETRGLLSRIRQVISDGTTDILAPAFHQYFIPCPPNPPSLRFDRMQHRVTMAPLRDADCIIGALITLEDVTDRREREIQLAIDLASGNEATRLKATQELAQDPLEVGPQLVGALADASWRVRRTAVDGLTRHISHETVAHLLLALRERHRDCNTLNSALSVLAMSDMDVVSPLISFLGDPNPDLRVYAALALGLHADPRAIPALLTALRDPDANVQYHAIEALGRLRSREAVESLIAIAETRDFYLAFPALDALAHIGDSSVAGRIVPLLQDPLLHTAAIDALGVLGDESAIQPLAALLNESALPALAVAQALLRLHDQYERAFSEGALISQLVRQTLNPTGAQKLLAALGNPQCADIQPLVRVLGWLSDSNAEYALVRLLGEPRVQNDIIEALVRHGNQVSQSLIKELTDVDPEVRTAAAVTLGRIGDRQAVPALLNLVLTDPTCLLPAVGALARISDPRALEPLLTVLESPEPAVRQAAIAALDALDHPDLPRHVVRLLASPNPRARESAARIAGLGRFASSLDSLLALCNDSDENVRRAVAESIAYFADPRVLPALNKALTEDSPLVRASAAQGLGHTGLPSAVPPLVQALTDSAPWVRYFSAIALGELRAPEALEPLARAAHNDPACQVKAGALSAIGGLGGSRAAAILVSFADCPENDLASAAIRALGKISHPDSLPPLMAALRSPVVERRLEAIRALSERGGSGVEGALQWVGTVDSNSSVAQCALEALGRCGSPEAIASLIALAAYSSHRDLCIAALARAGVERVELVAKGLSHSYAPIRAAVVQALARLNCPLAAEHIDRALNDSDPSVRLAADRASRHIRRRRADNHFVSTTAADPATAANRAPEKTSRTLM